MTRPGKETTEDFFVCYFFVSTVTTTTTTTTITIQSIPCIATFIRQSLWQNWICAKATGVCWIYWRKAAVSTYTQWIDDEFLFLFHVYGFEGLLLKSTLLSFLTCQSSYIWNNKSYRDFFFALLLQLYVRSTDLKIFHQFLLDGKVYVIKISHQNNIP